MRVPSLACLLITLTITASVCQGQNVGNSVYSQSAGKARLEQNQQRLRTVLKDEQPPSATSTFVDANVLMNVKADEYVAVFGVLEDGATAAECNQKMTATLKSFQAQLAQLGIGNADLFVDFVAQHKIFSVDVDSATAIEKLAGFELKKNVCIRYKDHNLLDKLVSAATAAGVFDLVKVEYIVKDQNRIHDRLMEEAAKIVKQKRGRYEQLLSIKLQPPAQVFAERTSVHFPPNNYDSYTATESESGFSRTVKLARKSTTFFWNGLDADGFDTVIDPVTLEPPVQFTLYLKVKCEVAQAGAQ